MVQRSLTGLVALIFALASALAVAEGNTAITENQLQTLSLSELCDARADAKAWAELERRQDFSDRELRAIRRERIREGISEDALRCFKGRPDSIVAAISDFGSGPVDALIYDSGTTAQVVAYVLREGDRGTVIKSVETEHVYREAPARPRDRSIAYDGLASQPGGLLTPETAGTRHHRRAVSSNQPGEVSLPQ